VRAARRGPVARRGQLQRRGPVARLGPVARRGQAQRRGRVARRGHVQRRGRVLRQGPVARPWDEVLRPVVRSFRPVVRSFPQVARSLRQVVRSRLGMGPRRGAGPQANDHEPRRNERLSPWRSPQRASGPHPRSSLFRHRLRSYPRLAPHWVTGRHDQPVPNCPGTLFSCSDWLASGHSDIPRSRFVTKRPASTDPHPAFIMSRVVGVLAGMAKPGHGARRRRRGVSARVKNSPRMAKAWSTLPAPGAVHGANARRGHGAGTRRGPRCQCPARPRCRRPAPVDGASAPRGGADVRPPGTARDMP
jgi:hypothetical protein